ncbi:cobalt-precorrin 3 C17-methyltransferase [Proteiniborus ethanoligenes]|uniref:Cobalt-precorrin 3 C17-methyltransferase n=1 Tax=Proteiniborus ethanoligenes TaxID=415015 RepID=A0A1H3QJZ4_9FIRM|nr:precorrin-3B C(17)-methyltransferase [Proteiniborus ethanoligenes]SDZ13633.1 cobalt-precorrin 3 C17-methyltransferase [Proteiniborus ethanoligenes]
MNKAGKIFVVGLGPGDRAHMTLEAKAVIEKSDVIVGYKTYIDLIKDMIEDKEVFSSGMKKEIERCTETLEIAKQGKVVSLVSSGDSGVYGMAGIMLEVVSKAESDIKVEIIPGVTASNAAAASLGAPIMHDYATISLSDLLTDWSLIEKRLHYAGQGDFVVCLYNPKSKGRQKQIEIAREILLKYKKQDTIVGIVKNAKRDGETVVITTLKDMLKHEIDMFTTVIVGNSNTYLVNGKIITPRGYKL